MQKQKPPTPRLRFRGLGMAGHHAKIQNSRQSSLGKSLILRWQTRRKFGEDFAFHNSRSRRNFLSLLFSIPVCSRISNT